MVGIPVRTAALDLQRLVLDEMDLVGVRGSAGEMRAVIPLVRDGRIRVTPLITHHFPLEDFAEAVSAFNERRDGAVKVVIHPWGTMAIGGTRAEIDGCSIGGDDVS